MGELIVDYLEHHLHVSHLSRMPGISSFENCGDEESIGLRMRTVRGDWVEAHSDAEACESIEVVMGEWIAYHYFTNPENRGHESNKREMLATVGHNLGNPYNTEAALHAADRMYDQLLRSPPIHYLDEVFD